MNIPQNIVNFFIIVFMVFYFIQFKIVVQTLLEFKQRIDRLLKLYEDMNDKIEGDL